VRRALEFSPRCETVGHGCESAQSLPVNRGARPLVFAACQALWLTWSRGAPRRPRGSRFRPIDLPRDVADPDRWRARQRSCVPSGSVL